MVILMIGLVGWLSNYFQVKLHNPAFATGWLMLILIFFLAAFNLRKKITFLRLGKASSWTIWHIYLGWAVSGIFLIHIGFSFPMGMFEQLLALIFSLEILTGIYGVFLNATRPAALTRRGENVIFEKIPSIRIRIKTEIQRLVEQAAGQSESTALIDFYQKRLLVFLTGSQHFWYHVFESERPKQIWRTQFQALQRYLSDAEKVALDEIKILTFEKVDLDFQQAGQALLKRWLFIHIPLSSVLLILIFIHVLTSISFTGQLL